MKKNTRGTPPVLRMRIDSHPYRILEEISGGDLFVGFLFSARSTRRMYRIARERAQERYRNKQAILKLKAHNYVREVMQNGVPSFFITREGKRALHMLYQHSSEQTRSAKQWDGMWRVIAYDFPEEERSARNSLRYILERAQFKQIQKSVWISPYDSQRFEELIAQHEVIKKHTLCMTVKNISNAALYKKHFHLDSAHP